MVLVKIVSPATLTVMAKIVMDHICSTQEHACTAATNQSEHYDPYDKSNNQAAHLFLLDSLDPHLQQSIEDRAPPENFTFIHAWMLFIQVLCSDSVTWF